MQHIFDWISHNARKTLLLVVLMTVALGSGLSQLKIDNNQESELPADDEIVLTNDKLKSAFGDKGLILIGVEAENGIYTTETLQKIAAISEDLKSIPYVIADEITSLSTLQNITSREWGLEREAFLKKIPASPEEMEQLKQDVINNKDVYGRMVSTDGKMAAITANVTEDYKQMEVSNAVFSMLEKYRDPQTIYVAGDAIQAQEIDSGIQKDTGVLLPTALGLILLCFLLTLRTLRGVVLPFAVVALSIVWTMGAMGWLGLAVTVVSSALPALMVAVASSYGIHIMLQYYERIARGEDNKAASSNASISIAPAIVLTGATSALGAITLIVFKVTSIQEFGIATAVGVLSATIISLTFMPAMLALMKPKQGKKWPLFDKNLENILIKTTAVAIKHKVKVVIGSTLLLTALCIVGLSQLRVGQDFIKYFEPDHRLRIAFEEFNAQLGGARFMDVMVTAKEENALENPRYLNQMKDFQNYAESLPHVGYSSSFANVIQRINLAMHDNDPAFDKIPDDEATIAQYLLLYSMSGTPGDQSNLIDYNHQKAKIRIMLTTSEQDDHKVLYEKLKTYAQHNFDEGLNVEFGGDVVFWLAQIHYIVKGKIENIIMSILVVFLFCAVVFRSFIGGIFSILPLSIATLLTLAMMGILGIRLDVGTAIVTAIGVGIGVDFTIHYLKRLLQEYSTTRNSLQAMKETSRTTGKAITYDTLSNVAGFSVFILSGFQPLQFFGWLISLMMVTSAIATLVIFPAIIAMIGEKFLNKHAVEDISSDTASDTI